MEAKKEEAEVSLIEAVARRRMLWDKSRADYNDAGKRSLQWKEIATEVGREESEWETVKKDWTKLRHYYSKVLRMSQRRKVSGSGGAEPDEEAIIMWKHAASMAFLKPALTDRPRTTTTATTNQPDNLPSEPVRVPLQPKTEPFETPGTISTDGSLFSQSDPASNYEDEPSFRNQPQPPEPKRSKTEVLLEQTSLILQLLSQPPQISTPPSPSSAFGSFVSSMLRPLSSPERRRKISSIAQILSE